MQFKKTAIHDVLLLEPAMAQDERGAFCRTYDADIFAKGGIGTQWPQHNLSFNRYRGTLRGMHYQRQPAEEGKIVRCVRGSVWDVAVDLRPDSPSFKKWTAQELSADSRRALYIPKGCAHGFITLEDNTELFYLMDNVYNPEYAAGVRWNDPAFDIKWPFEPRIMSDRDAGWPDFVS